MAHFAEVDKDPFAAARSSTPATVLRVIVVGDSDCVGSDGFEDEATGIAFCQAQLGGKWLQTSYNGSLRFNFAGAEYMWDGTGFYMPQPSPSWTLDSAYQWQPPVTKPDGIQNWDEDNQTWIEQKPFPSWTWDADGGRWEAPTPYPGVENGPLYEWDEATTSWVEVTE